MNNLDTCVNFSSDPSQSMPTIALIPWGDTWEDWFDSVGVSFDAFCNDLTGGWKNNYIDALKLAGVRVVMIYASTRVKEPSRFIHQPTGATICLLPVSRMYAAIRRQMIHPYPSLGYFESFEELFGEARGVKRLWLQILKHLASYLAMPLNLLVQELRHHSCHAILCQDYEQPRFDICVMLGKVLGLPVYSTFQGGAREYNRIGCLLRPFTMRNCTGLIIGTQSEIQRISDRYHIHPDQVAQIFNPVNLSRERACDRPTARSTFGLPETAQVVVWHGRIDIAQKGLLTLLKAWEQLCRERSGRDLWLLLMGTGPDAQEFQQHLSALSMHNIQWINQYINDRALIRQFLSAGDVYAFASRYEGFPVAPIEAMACGLPLVATEVDGIPDILKNGKQSGGIVVPIDDGEALARALGQLLDDASLRLELGQHARKRVEESFSLEVVGQQLRDFLLPSHTLNSERVPCLK